ncbi:MAG TPA: hypothetical protein VD999_04615 [Vitreimonas sp.]|nr:hypothetical protein [Vitreimonas sp.]
MSRSEDFHKDGHHINYGGWVHQNCSRRDKLKAAQEIQRLLNQQLQQLERDVARLLINGCIWSALPSEVIKISLESDNKVYNFDRPNRQETTHHDQSVWTLKDVISHLSRPDMTDTDLRDY